MSVAATTVQASSGRQPASGAHSLTALLVLALAIVAGFTAMGSFAIVQESAKAELHLTDTMLGLIQGVGAAVPLVIFSIPIGILVDRFNRLRLTMVLALLWTAGTLLTAYATGAAELFLARMMTGVGSAGAVTAAISLAADLCPPAQRGRAMLILTVGKSFGQAAAFALTGWLFGLVLANTLPLAFGLTPWRDTHIVLAILSAAASAPLLLLREPRRQEVESSPDAPFRVVARELWARRTFLVPLFIGQATVVMADAAAGIWAAPVLQRSYGLQPQQFAAWLGAVILVTGIAGSILGGLAADWGQKTGRRGGVLIGAVVAAAIGIPSALFPVMPTVPSYGAVLGLLILAGTVTGLVTSVALTVLIPNELRGLCIGAFLAFAGLIGFGIAPPLVARVSTWLGGEQQLGAALAIVGVIVSTVSVAGFALSIRHAPVAATQPPV